MYKRISDFYRLTTSGPGFDIGQIWGGITAQYHKNLTDALLRGNEQEIARAYELLAPSGALAGIEANTVFYPHEVVYQNLMQRLANRIGILPIQNPEQPSDDQNWKLKDVGVTLKSIEKLLGFRLSIPDCFGFQSGASGIPHRFFFYCSAAFTIQCQVQAWKHVLELGGGLGNMGFIAHHKQAKSYTVIDLPSVAAMSALFVSKVVGESNVWLFGEPENPLAFARFYPSTHYNDVSQKQYTVIFNSDSLPEMPVGTQDQYIKLISECLSPGGIFLSINHESNRIGQSSVFAATVRNGDLRLTARYPYMMRDGYIEEIYKTDSYV